MTHTIVLSIIVIVVGIASYMFGYSRCKAGAPEVGKDISELGKK